MDNRIKIAFFQSDLHVGGIQRSLVNYLWLFQADDRFRVDVYLFDDHDIFYDIPKADNIRIYFCKKFPYMNRLVPFGLLYALHGPALEKSILATMKAGNIEQYDLAIDFNSYWNECAIGALRVPAKKHICWVHNDVKVKLNEEFKYRILHFFFEKKYSRFDSMVMVSQGTVDPFYLVNQGAVKDHCVIPNPINTDEILEKIKSGTTDVHVDVDKVNLVSVGRLCHQKGFDLLLEEIARLKSTCIETGMSPDRYHFYIIGDGPDRKALMEQAASLKIEDCVSFLGNRENPFVIMKQCDAFIMMARYEGQPLAYWEAASLKLPIIIPKRLEPYTEGLPGCEDVVEAILRTEKRDLAEEVDRLIGYNMHILEQIVGLQNGL